MSDSTHGAFVPMHVPHRLQAQLPVRIVPSVVQRFCWSANRTEKCAYQLCFTHEPCLVAVLHKTTVVRQLLAFLTER